MARRYRKARSYGRTAYRGGKKAAGILGLSPAFLAGVAVGYTNLDDKLPQKAVLVAAVAPLKVKGFYQVKAGAQGVILGNMLQGYIQGNGGGTAASGFGV